MTNRFTGEFDKQYSGVHDNGEQLTNFEVVDLLNNLSEDNEYLEKRFKEEEWHYNHIDEDRDVWMYKCRELEKENEELKKDCSNLIDDNTEYVAEINQMHKENEQLKEQLADANELNKIYVDFMVDNGFELSDVIEYSRRKQ